MKKLLFSILCMSVISVTAFAQNSKIIVLINKASWCPVCKANEPRFIKEVLPNISNHSEAKIIFNDLSNHKTKEESKHEIEKEGLDQFIQKNKSTGVVYFLDVNTKSLISQISLAEDSEHIKMVFEEALKN